MAAEADGPQVLDADGLSLLAGCLTFSRDSAEIPELRRRLMAPGAFELAFKTAGICRLVPVLATEIERKGLAPPIPGRTGTVTAAAAVEEALARHAAERRDFAETLNEIIGLLTRAGIVPVLLKGARSLWTGRPEWRGMRDLDLLVAASEAGAAEKILLETGYGQAPETRERRRHHHRTPLIRAVSPGWIEIHTRAGNHYAEKLLPTEELLAASMIETGAVGRVRLLSPTHHVLHAMIHHHAGHSAFARRTMDIKGLYEFVWDLRDLGGAGRVELHRRTGLHPRLAAMLDLWVAAAADLFAFVAPAPFVVDVDATVRWRDMRGRITGAPAGSKLKGYAAEFAFAAATARLRRQPDGGTVLGRQKKRLKIAGSLMPRQIWADW